MLRVSKKRDLRSISYVWYGDRNGCKQAWCLPSLSSDMSYFFSVIGVSPGFRRHPISIMCHICHEESHRDHFMNQANQSFALQILTLILWILKAWSQLAEEMMLKRINPSGAGT